MTEQEFEKLIDKNKTQVFLFLCPTSIPVNIFRHGWFVVNRQGVLVRWEVTHWHEYKNAVHWGHVYKDILPPFQGLQRLVTLSGVFSFLGNWQPKLLGKWEDELAEKMATVLENAKENFPYCHKYHFFPGPNSNTFLGWFTRQFPEAGIELSWRFIGKNYK